MCVANSRTAGSIFARSIRSLNWRCAALSVPLDSRVISWAWGERVRKIASLVWPHARAVRSSSKVGSRVGAPSRPVVDARIVCPTAVATWLLRNDSATQSTISDWSSNSLFPVPFGSSSNALFRPRACGVRRSSGLA